MKERDCLKKGMILRNNVLYFGIKIPYFFLVFLHFKSKWFTYRYNINQTTLTRWEYASPKTKTKSADTNQKEGENIKGLFPMDLMKKN